MRVVVALHVRAALQPDQRTQLARVLEREPSTIRPPIEQPITTALEPERAPRP